jgi:hypothetical protein
MVGEITFIAPLRSGKVSGEETWHDHPEHTGTRTIERPLRYADRLRLVLEAFNDRESLYDGKRVRRVPMALRAFGGIHFAHLAMLDGDTRLLFSVDFDGTPNDYLSGLAHTVPALLHMVFCNCVGWTDVRGKPKRLIEFVEAHQVRTNFWFAHSPGLSVKDIEWLDALRTELEKAPATTPSLTELRRLVTRVSAPLSQEHRLEQMFTQLASTKDGADDQRACAQRQFLEAFSPYYPAEVVRAAMTESLGPVVEIAAALTGDNT